MKGRSRSGNTLLEFTLLGVPLLFFTVSIVEVSLAMWTYHNLAFATGATARYITMHGATCSQNSNTCTITTGDVATFFISQGLALNSSQVTLTLTDGSGSTVCNPVDSCTASATQFPSPSYNSIGSDVTVKATCTIRNPLIMFWPNDTGSIGSVALAATSTQRIVF